MDEDEQFDNRLMGTDSSSFLARGRPFPPSTTFHLMASLNPSSSSRTSLDDTVGGEVDIVDIEGIGEKHDAGVGEINEVGVEAIDK